jgi:hypothetical protein
MFAAVRGCDLIRSFSAKSEALREASPQSRTFSVELKNRAKHGRIQPKSEQYY